MALSTYYSGLFDRLQQGKLSPEETENVVEMLSRDNTDPDVKQLLLQHLQREHTAEEITPELTAALQARLSSILTKASPRRIHRISLYRRKWVQVAAAAVLLAAATGFWVWVKRPVKPETKIAQRPPAPEKSEILPGKEGAVLTLDDGRTIVLDSLGNGVIAAQNGTTVTLSNGQLKYNNDKNAIAEVAYNTMTTPRGRQFQLQLPDGTKAWLNAASSLRYPTVFTGSERSVEVTGEVYFEVAKNAAMPFRVKVKNSPAEIKVLGTHFNVNAYEETGIHTTLLEGAVRITSGSEEALLRPGQQAQAGGREKAAVRILNGVNIQKVMAWKNGVFDFEDATLEEVMHQLERWYDIDVVYEKGIPRLEFMGKMGRDLSLSEVLRGLEISEVHFKIDGRKLIVKP